MCVCARGKPIYKASVEGVTFAPHNRVVSSCAPLTGFFSGTFFEKQLLGMLRPNGQVTPLAAQPCGTAARGGGKKNVYTHYTKNT